MTTESLLKDKVILVVDDEPDVLETLAEELDMCQDHKSADYDTALQFLLSYTYDIVTRVEAAMQIVYKAASVFEEILKDMERLPKETVRYSAIAKLFAAETAMKVTTDAVQLLGGYGYVKDYPVERMMRNAKITRIYEGTSQIQKIVISSTL